MDKELIMKITSPKQPRIHSILLEFTEIEAKEIMGLVQNTFYLDSPESPVVSEFRENIFNLLKESING